MILTHLVLFFFGGAGGATATTTTTEGARGGGFYEFGKPQSRKKIEKDARTELRRIWEEIENGPREIRREAAETVIIAQKRAQDKPATLPERVRFPKFSDVNWAAVLQVVSIELLRDIARRADDEEDEDFLLLN